MELEEFIKHVEEEFDEIKPGSLSPDIDYSELVSWNSMNALMLMGLIKIELGVTVSPQELQECKTMRELYNMVLTKQN